MTVRGFKGIIRDWDCTGFGFVEVAGLIFFYAVSMGVMIKSQRKSTMLPPYSAPSLVPRPHPVHARRVWARDYILEGHGI